MINNDLFNKENINNLKEGEELFILLMKKALNEKQSNFEFIKS
jgi:hypothetical protein